MQSSKILLSVLLSFSLIVVSGCSDDSTNTTADYGVDSAIADVGSGGDTGSTKDGKVAADRGKSFSFTVRFRDHLTSAFIAGVKMCVKEDTSIACVTSQGTGMTSGAQITLPTGKDLTLVVTKAGYLDRALPVGKDNLEDSYSLDMFPTSMLTTIGTKAGVTVDSTKAMLIVNAVDYLGGGYGNAKLTLTPASGKGPMASDKDGYPDPTKTTTGSLGLGWAWYLNLPAGDYTLTVKDNDGHICEVLLGWQGKTKAEAKVKPVVNAVNGIWFRCKEQKT